LHRSLSDHIIILDGAFGSMAQRMRLPAHDFTLGGANAAGCCDILCLTRPDAVKDIHMQYLRAGADIITTNSFSANALSLADYGLADRAAEIAATAASIARSAADGYARAEGRKCLVAGSIGPTRHALSMPPGDGAAIDFAAMRRAFAEQAKALMRGGADLMLIETVYDALNAKAALDAVRLIDRDFPIIISATISDASGRLLSGQDIATFCASVIHACPMAICLNCGQGAGHLLPHLRSLSGTATCAVGCYPSAGLPNCEGSYDETPETMADRMRPYFTEGLVDIAGGCCGTTPAHIRAIADIARRYSPRLTRHAGK